MYNGPLSGRIGPIRDPASGQPVHGTVQGSFGFQTNGDPNVVGPQLQAALLGAIARVLEQKLAANQVAIPTIPASLPHFIPEIVAASGAASIGANVTALQLQLSMENPTAVQPYTGALPPDPIQATKNAFAQAAQDRLDPRNYEYAAKVNIGGFKLKASTDGGFDTDGLKSQVKDKVKTELIWYGIGCVIVGLVLIGALVLGWYVYSQVVLSSSGKATSAPTSIASWDGKSPFSCGGGDSIRLEGVTATFTSGTAVSAKGNCRLELVNVTLDAPTAIEALSSASVTVTGGSVTGKSFAAKALGNAQITFVGTKITGKTQALGAAKISGP